MLFYLLCVGFLDAADMHSLSLIHTDLKPENVLLVSPEYTKVVDRKVTFCRVQYGSYSWLSHMVLVVIITANMLCLLYLVLIWLGSFGAYRTPQSIRFI